MMFPKPRPAVFDKRDLHRERERIAQAAIAAVYERDDYRCRCCGRAKGRGVALHIHHLVFRSRGGPDSTENELVLCVYCHSLLHARQLWILGKNADKRLTFEIQEAAVVEVFGNAVLPPHVRMIAPARREA